jgi:endonuclease/exonuclease/phosphatase family metal-dependent hydrolase
MRHRNFFFMAIAAALTTGSALLLYSCEQPGELYSRSQRRITIMTWNAQTFFDAVNSGNEFEEFRDGKNEWNAEKYGERLDRLCAVIALCGKRSGEEPLSGPDVAVLEEIENEGVVRDICNRLNQRTTYRYAAFVPPAEGSAFGSAVLSRLPVTGITAHAVGAPQSSGTESMALRPMLEVSLRVGDETLTVFAVHWKSKSGDGDESDDGLTPSASARRAQERLLSERIAKLGNDSAPWVACGDFNQRYDEFTLLGEYADCWDSWLARCESGEIPGPAGSYYYDKAWETIDHFFVPKAFIARDDPTATWVVSDFRVIAESPIADADLVPNRYVIFSGKGVSDHLPLILALEKRN